MTLSAPSYIQPVYRPPAEANSVIFQVTNGCSWNKCTYCEMYTDPQKKFRARPEAEALEEIATVGRSPMSSEIKRVFLADGDAMVLSTKKLMTILKAIETHLPSVRRVGSYCIPKNVLKKSDQELKELQEAGLKIAYVGAESGDDTVLRKINKGESYATTATGLLSLKRASIKTSVMILNGIGGSLYSKDHAIHTANLVNETQPELLASLVVSFPQGEERLKKEFPEFSMLDTLGLIKEMKTFIEHTELERTIFRSNHASNYLELKGTLGKSKANLLKTIDDVLSAPDQANLKPEWMRGL